MECQKCREHPAVSHALGLCEVCLYEAEMGPEKTALQVERGLADRERKKEERAKKRGRK